MDSQEPTTLASGMMLRAKKTKPIQEVTAQETEEQEDSVPHDHLGYQDPKRGFKKKFSIFCNICRKGFMAEESLRLHVRAHRFGKPFACPHCPKRFMGADYLEVHKKQCQRKLGKSGAFACCGKTFTELQRLRTHQTIVHKRKVVREMTAAANRTIKTRQQTKGKLVSQDKQGGKKFSSPKHLENHQRISRSHNEVGGGVETPKGNATKPPPQNQGNEQSLVCCGITYSSLRYLKTHQTKCHKNGNDKPPTVLVGKGRRGQIFPCTACDKTFKKEQNLRYHMMKHTGIGVEVITCGFCHKVFSNRSKRLDHEKKCKVKQAGMTSGTKTKAPVKTKTPRTKTKKRAKTIKKPETVTTVSWSTANLPTYPRKCTSCPKFFWSAEKFLEHLYIHISPAVYPCHACYSDFVKKDYLTNHEAGIHGDGEATPFNCTQCQMGFQEEDELVKHERFHSGEDEPAAGKSN